MYRKFRKNIQILKECQFEKNKNFEGILKFEKMNTFQVSNGLPAKSQQSVPYCLQLGKIEMLLIENIFYLHIAIL